ALLPALICVLTWLFIRLREASHIQGSLENIDGVVEHDAPSRPKSVLGMKPSRVGLMAICISALFVDGASLRFRPSVNVAESADVGIPAHALAYCLRSDRQIYQPANGVCSSGDKLVTP